MSTTPPGSISASPPSKKNRWSRVGTVIRRSSTAFSIPGVRAASPSPSERERDSDSASIKGSSKPGSIKQLETGALSPPAGNGNGAPSPIAESPAREAAALASEPVGPSPLASGDVVTASPEATLEPPTINEVPPTPATPAPAPEPALAVEAEPEVAPVAEEEPAPKYTSSPPTETGGQTTPPSIHEQDVSVEQAPAVEAPAEPVPPIVEEQLHETAPSIASEIGITEQPAPAVPDLERPAAYFEMPAPQPVVPSGDYSTNIWASEGQNPRGGVSAKQSTASLASSAAWSNAHGNENAEYLQGKSTIKMPSDDDPFADPTQEATAVSPADTIRVPEPLDPRSPREEAYQPIISMPLPPVQDVIPSQSARNLVSGYSLSTKSGTSPVEPGAQPTNERIPLLARSTSPQQGQGKAFYAQEGAPSRLTPSIRSGVVADSHTMPRLQALGWSEHVLPDAAIYFVHPNLRVVTDIDMRNLKQLEIVTAYLERDGDGFKVPQGCELWLRDAAEGKRRDCVPVRNWVDHGKRVVSFEPPWERESHYLHEDDKLDLHYRYWSFMEAHPAHAPLSMAAHAEATDVLTWSYTDRLLPLSRPVPPPFTQEECQELMNLLRSFGAAPDTSGIQTVVHTRIVARILLRIARWRQTHFRPHRPLPHDAHKTRHSHARPHPSFLRTVFDFVVGFICLGIPYLFIDRAHHHQVDEESGLHGAGPMLVIGACSCLAAAVILSASVTFMSFPGLDNIARLAGFVAILCSAASMSASVIALFRYKADMERTVWHYDMAGSGMMLTRRSILLSLPLVFLAYSLAGLITSVVIYSFRGPSITPPGYPMHYDDYVKWTVIGTFGGLGSVLVLSALLGRR